MNNKPIKYINIDGVLIEKIHLSGKFYKHNKRINHNLFSDIETCPICTMIKPIDQFTIREISHMSRHIKSVENEL